LTVCFSQTSGNSCRIQFQSRVESSQEEKNFIHLALAKTDISSQHHGAQL
jgi:hypothetical protein